MENYLKTRKVLGYDDLTIPAAGDSTEQLVDVRAYDDTIVALYNKEEMKPYTGDRIFVRDTLARKLADVNAALKASYGCSLKVVYGYRHPEVQEFYFSRRKATLKKANPDLDEEALNRYTHDFIAVPDVAGHPVGGAVDLTIIDAQGDELDMGTAIADFTDEEHIRTFSKKATDEQRSNRLLLHDAMITKGFAPFYGEWWHFCYGDREWAAFYHKQAALYGALDFKV